MTGTLWQDHRPLARPIPVALVGAVGLMLLAPTLLLTLFPSGPADPGHKPLIPNIAVILFATGWLLVGAALQPGGSAWSGLALAALLYGAVGVAWVIGFNLRLGAPLADLLPDLLSPTALRIMLGWPLQVAQVLGLFDLQLA